MTSGTDFLLSVRKLSGLLIRSLKVPPVPSDLRALLYVSDTLLPHRTAAQDLAAIVAVSRRNNAARQISGALMATEQHFVQFLEGPSAALEALLVALRKDHRHHKLHLLRNGPAQCRRFAHWSLAYCGPQDFIATLIDGAMGVGAEGGQACDDLVDMMVAFAGAILPENDGDDAGRV